MKSLELAALEWVTWFKHQRLLEPIGYIPQPRLRIGIICNPPCGLNTPALKPRSLYATRSDSEKENPTPKEVGFFNFGGLPESRARHQRIMSFLEKEKAPGSSDLGASSESQLMLSKVAPYGVKVAAYAVTHNIELDKSF